MIEGTPSRRRTCRRVAAQSAVARTRTPERSDGTLNLSWPAISDLELCIFPFPGIRFRFPFSPYPPFSLFPGNVSAFFCKIHKLPVILCHFPQFRQNSVKFAAKNARFAEKSAKFSENPENSTKKCKITQKLALERCKGVTIL